MGLFDFLKRQAPVLPADDEPVPPAPGWDAIEQAFAKVYPDQRAMQWTHQGVMRMHDLRDPPENPFDAVNIYDAGTFWHYVSFGMSELYEKESDSEWSGFGYEFTFRLAKSGENAPLWPINVMGSLARAAFTGSIFGPGHTVKIGPIDGRPETKLDALLLAVDPSLALLDTPHGHVGFLLLVGVEDAVRQRALKEGVGVVLDELRLENPALVTRP
jgi:suppressor of fused-like protein